MSWSCKPWHSAAKRPWRCYKRKAVGEGRIDLLVDDALVVELKVVDQLMPIHTAQVLSYLKAMQLSTGF
jgi:GxxExxY protein